MDELLTRVDSERRLLQALQNAGADYATLSTRLKEIDSHKLNRALRDLGVTVDLQHDSAITLHALLDTLCGSTNKTHDC
ncbi:hypothetical protein [Pseudomonas urmiensis]|uniref:Uncharacterized protein n=1 Tax=Pseudomonas urmiensis TaxID=2745493 RepID=A0A923FZH2_9PSED|nr:hypothetical protein [Pseudomonas urmiensis]MBV4536802.1 hypothetical protein [Pseudomonas urmiensis]